MFCEAMRDRGVEVFEAEDLLAQALASPEARDWVCGHILNEREVGITAAQRAAEWAGSADPALVAEFLIGGITKTDVARDAGLVWESADPTSMLPPLPNFLFQRDPSCWIYDGVTINPMTKPARKPETMIMETSTGSARCSPPRSSPSGSAGSAKTGAVPTSRAGTCSPSATAR